MIQTTKPDNLTTSYHINNLPDNIGNMSMETDDGRLIEIIDRGRNSFC